MIDDKMDMDMINLNTEQEMAVARAAIDRILIINGGAGCGKTTIIRQICRNMPEASFWLCAFAGKAATRMAEATGHEATTIHRLLGYDGKKFTTKSLEGMTIIVDEASMLPSALLAAIVVRRPAQLILVGDEAQLPPVGVGQPFHDLIARRRHLVVTLTKCYRSTEAIYQASQAIRNGQMPPPLIQSKNEKFIMRQTGDKVATHNAILDMVREGEIDFEQDLVLTPRNEDCDGCSVQKLNQDIVQIVNPRGDGWNRKFAPGDRIINLLNVPRLDLWNGTTGTIAAMAKNRMTLQTDSGSIDVCNSDVNLEHAYALTVHKAQGSQYRKVVIAILARDSYRLLNRAMVYTAVSRAKRECIVLGDRAAFRHAIETMSHKRTVLQEML